MKKKRRQKSDREVFKKIFPPEVVKEVDAILEEIDEKPKFRSNPPKRPLKPWGRKWVEEKKSE